MRQLPEYCEDCGIEIRTLETCVLPDGIEKRGAEVTFKESAEGGIRCVGCAGGEHSADDAVRRRLERMRAVMPIDAEGNFVLDDSHEYLDIYDTRRGREKR